jgi:F-type H+-transporting ATPase subunit b
VAFATVIVSASEPASVEVFFAQEGTEHQETGTTSEEEPPNPILPVGKEIAWGFGSFLVLFVLMRYVLLPKVKAGMDARAQHIASDHATAEQLTTEAEAEVAEYQSQLTAIRAEGQSRIDAARAEVEAERRSRLGEVNARLGQQRAEAAAEVEAAKQAAMGQVADAVAEVTVAAAARVLGRDVDRARVRTAVDEVVSAGVTG